MKQKEIWITSASHITHISSNIKHTKELGKKDCDRTLTDREGTDLEFDHIHFKYIDLVIDI